MDFLLDRQNRQYLQILSGLVFCMMLLLLSSGYWTLSRSRDRIFLREQQIASALLAEGVPAGQIAAALASEERTEAGRALLGQMGHLSETPPLLFPVLREDVFSRRLMPLLTVWAALGAAFLLSAVWYLRKRDHLYQTASELVDRFTEGDFSGHLSMGCQDGTIEHLFVSVDQLARALKAGYEAEHDHREFLKHTISDISHQLKTPLAALHLYMDILTGEPDRPDTVRAFSRRSMQSLLRMEALVQALLKIVRLDAGSISFTPIRMSVRELILRAAEPLQARAGQEHKQLQILGDSEEMLCCDPEWTAEAVGNLIKNALDHTKENSIIRIYWKRSPAMLRLSVSDDGCGIAQEDIHHIFKRFYRSCRSSDRQGTGLGLPLAKAIIEGQGGTLSVTSEEGAGATFSISFPDEPSDLRQLTKS